MNTNVKGLIIRETSVGEADKVLTMLAHDMGRISVWAKGARRMKSPFLAASQCFTYADYTLFSSKGTYKMNQAELIDNFYELRRDITRLSLANYLAELAGCAVLEGSCDNCALSLTLNALHLLARTDKPAVLIKCVYELRLLQIAGYMPDTMECAECGTPMTEGFIDCAGGIALCRDCGSEQLGLLYADVSVYKAISYILSAPTGKEFSFLLPADKLCILSEICERFVLEHVHSSFKTLEFYKSVQNT